MNQNIYGVTQYPYGCMYSADTTSGSMDPFFLNSDPSGNLSVNNREIVCSVNAQFSNRHIAQSSPLKAYLPSPPFEANTPVSQGALNQSMQLSGSLRSIQRQPPGQLYLNAVNVGGVLPNGQISHDTMVIPHALVGNNADDQKGGIIKKYERARYVFSAEQLQSLRLTFSQTQYPTREDREGLASSLGLKYRQVNVWFQNKRAMLKREKNRTQAEAPSGNSPLAGSSHALNTVGVVSSYPNKFVGREHIQTESVPSDSSNPHGSIGYANVSEPFQNIGSAMEALPPFAKNNSAWSSNTANPDEDIVDIVDLLSSFF